MLNNRFVQFEIEEKAFHKLKNYEKFAEDEIGGLLDVRINGKVIQIKDAILLKQTASAGSFTLDDEDLSKYMEKILVKKAHHLKNLRGWWHKHPIEDWSYWDDTTFENLKKFFGNFIVGLALTPSGFLFRLEVGKRQYVQFNTPNFKIVVSNRKIDKRALSRKCKSQVERLVEKEKAQLDSIQIIDYTGIQTQIPFGTGVEETEQKDHYSITSWLARKLKQSFNCKMLRNCVNCPYLYDCKETYEKLNPLSNQNEGIYFQDVK